MAGAFDLYSGGNSISGSNLFYVDKSPLDQFLGSLNDVGQRQTFLETFETFVQGVIDKVVEFFEALTGLNINEGPIPFFASLFERLNNLTGLVWDDGPISFLVSIVDAVVTTIETLTGLNINEGVEPFLASLWANLENATGLNWDEGPIPFLVSVVDAVVSAIETLTSLNINEGPGPFFDSLWAALEAATGLVWSEGPLPFLESAVTATINTIELLTGLNIDEGPVEFLNSFWTALENATGFDWTHGPAAFLESVVSVTVTAIENLTNLNIDEGPIAFFESLFTALEGATGLDWTHGPGPFVESVVTNVIASIEYLTGLNIDAGPEAFINSLFYEIITGPSVALGEMMQALDATGQGLAEKIGRAIIAVISGIPFVGNAIADTLTDLLDGLVLWVRGGNQSGTNLINDPGAENAKFWEAVYPTNHPTVALRGTRKQPEVTRDTSIKRSAGASLRVTSGGVDPKSFYWNINDLGDVVPISASVGDWFYAECYVFVPSTNTGSAAVTLVAELRNSTNINTITTETVTLGVVKSSGLTDPWQKIAGSFTVPTGYDRISFGFLLGANNTTTGDKFYVDDMMVREVTGTQNTLQGIHQAIRGGDGTSLISLSAVGTALGGLTDLTRGTSEAGSNLLVDPKASYPNLWIGTGLSTSTTVGTYKSASRSLVLTSAGATLRSFDWTVNDTGATTPIVAQPGDVFYCECYVLSPPGNSAATVILHGKARNSSTGSTLTLTPQLSATVVASGPWTKISGQYTIPSSGYDQFIAGITLAGGTTTSGDKFYIDDMVVREVTGTQTTIDALGQAVSASAPTGNTITNVRDAVANVFDLSRGNTQSGSNLVADPKISYPNWWNGQAGTVASSTYSRSTINSLRITSINPTQRLVDFTVNDLGVVAPLVTRPGNVYYCEAWVYSPVGNAQCLLQLHGAVYNLATGLRGTIAVQAGSNEYAVYPTQGTWVQVYAYFKIPATFTPDGGGAAKIPDGFVSGITLLSGWTTAGNNFYIDDLTIQDVTESYNTNIKLYNAPQPAAEVLSSAIPTLTESKIPTLSAGKVTGLTDLTTTVNGGPGVTGLVTTTSGLNTTVNGGTGVTGLTTTVPGVINAIGQGINKTTTTYAYTGIKDSVQRFVSAIGVGLAGQPASRLDAMASGAGYSSYLDMLAIGNTTASSISAVAASVAELQKKSSGTTTGGMSAYVPFTSTGLAAFSKTTITGTSNYVSSGSQVYWSGTGGRQVGVYPTVTTTNSQKIGVAFGSAPAADNLLGVIGNQAYNYILGRSNSVGSVCVFAKFSINQCWLGYTINNFATEGIAAGPFAHNFNPTAVYWLECGTNSGETYYRISNGGGTIVETGALSFWSSYTNASYRYGGWGGFAAQPLWTNAPGSMAAWSLADNIPIDYPGLAFRRYRNTAGNTASGVAGTAGTMVIHQFPASWYNIPDVLTTATGSPTYGADNSVTINQAGWYQVDMSQRVISTTVASAGGFHLVLQNTTQSKNYASAPFFVSSSGTQAFSASLSTMVYCKKNDVLRFAYGNSHTGAYQMSSTAAAGETWVSVNYVNTSVA